MRIWNNLSYFTKNENWGDPDKIDPSLLFVLDFLRDRLGYPIHINCAYEPIGHAAKSQHYLGKAVDFVVVGIPFEKAYSLIATALAELGIACQVGFGVYPDWNTPGFHLDVRGRKARWGRWRGCYTGISQAMVNYRKEQQA